METGVICMYGRGCWKEGKSVQDVGNGSLGCVIVDGC